ncbi:MAG: signal peptide peptidase SppA [Haloarculaceae archaeon]
MTDRTTTAGRILLVVLAAVLAAAAGWVLFVLLPEGELARLLGVLLALGLLLLGVRVGGRFADSAFPTHNVAEVAVDGPITRDGGSPSFPPTGPTSPGADDVVERIERADEDEASEALLLHLNTPGGKVVPSDDIRRAAADFDGPTVAYTTDVCASGGYWIASGCDELWAREGSVVGSIGVRGSRVTGRELLDRVGLDYEQFTAGEYKEAGAFPTEIDEDQRRYLQGLVDDYYDLFVETVAEGRDADPETLRETEAKVFLGGEAHERGLVDEMGTREDALDRLEETLDEAATVRELSPTRSPLRRLRGGAAAVAYAFGAGVASALVPDGSTERFRFD